jgi:hypothetical protein
LPTIYLSTLTFNGSSLAVGSSLYQDTSYIYYVFMNNGSITPITSGVAHDILLVAGGGGGGQGHGGGGGAGGVIAYMNQSLPVGVAISVVVGQGGAGAPSSTANGARAQGFNGGHSLFGSLIAYGGGGGGSYTITAGPQGAGRGGGSGGGGGGNPSTVIGGSAVTGQGYGGGAGYTCDIAGRGGGGGGAGSVGGSASGTGTCTLIGSGSGGTGGAAVSTVTSWGSLASVLGLSGLGFWGQIAGGGGGGSWGSGVISPGGGGGAGSAPGAASSDSDYANAGQAALPSTGSGGGGGPDNSVGGGAGGSGFVVVRVAKSSKLALSKVPYSAPPPPPLATSFLFSQPSSTFIGTSSSTILDVVGTVGDVRAIVLTGGTISGAYISGVSSAGTALPVTPSADFSSSASTTYWYLLCLNNGLVKSIIVKVFLSSGSVYFQAISAWYANPTNGLPSTSAAVDALYAAKSGTFDVVTSSTGNGYGVCGLQGSAPLSASFLFSQPSSTFIGTSSSTILVLPSTVSDVRAIVLTGGTISGAYINQGIPLAGTALPVTPSTTFPSSASTTYWYLFCLNGPFKSIIVKVFLSSGSVYFQAISAWYTITSNGLPTTSAAVDALYAAKTDFMTVVTSPTGNGYGVCGLQGAAYFDGKSLPVTYYPTVFFPGGVALAQGNLLGTILSLPSKYTLSFDLLPTATPASDRLGILQLISAEALFTVTSSAVDIYSDGGGAILRLMHMTSGRFLIDSFNRDGDITSSLLSVSIAPVVPLRKTTTVTITMDLSGGSASAFTIWMTGGVSFSKTTTFTPKTTAFANVRVFAVPPTNPGIGASAPASARIRNVKITPGVVPAPPLVWLDASKASSLSLVGAVVSTWSSTAEAPFGVQFTVDQGSLSGATWGASALGSSLPGVVFSSAGMKSTTSPNLPASGDYSLVFVGTMGSQAAVYGALFGHGNRDMDVVLERDGGSSNIIFQSNNEGNCPVSYTANQPMIIIATNTAGILRNIWAVNSNGQQTSASCSNTYSLGSGPQSIRIGESDNTNEHSNGVVSEIIYYQRVLSASEISAFKGSLCSKWLGISC